MDAVVQTLKTFLFLLGISALIVAYLCYKNGGIK